MKLIKAIKEYIIYQYNEYKGIVNRTCFNCKFYGKCHVDIKKCNDWITFNNIPNLKNPYKEVDNIESFNSEWMNKHKKQYEKYFMPILEQRISNVRNREREREGDFQL